MVDKRIRLINALVSQTQSGKVTWERTVKDDAFRASLPNYSVTIRHVYREDQQQEEAVLDCVIAILNDEGAVVDEFSDVDMTAIGMEKAFTVMESLHDVARRQAMGVDAAMDSLLKTLEAPPEEDIPF